MSSDQDNLLIQMIRISPRIVFPSTFFFFFCPGKLLSVEIGDGVTTIPSLLYSPICLSYFLDSFGLHSLSQTVICASGRPKWTCRNSQSVYCTTTDHSYTFPLPWLRREKWMGQPSLQFSPRLPVLTVCSSRSPTNVTQSLLQPGNVSADTAAFGSTPLMASLQRDYQLVMMWQITLTARERE